MKNGYALRLAPVLYLLFVWFSPAAAQQDYQPDLSGFVSLFDGESLEGWHRFSDYNEGEWTVEDGAIVGRQSAGGGGGLLVSDGIYRSYELYAEVYATWPLDTGLFLRIMPGRQHYQITIDYRPTGEVGAVYGPFPGGGGGFYQHCCRGLSHWNPNEFNKVMVRIEDNPPRFQVWVNGDKIQDYQDRYYNNQPAFPDSGSVGIQVHAGESWGQGSKVAFRKLMIRELE